MEEHLENVYTLPYKIMPKQCYIVLKMSEQIDLFYSGYFEYIFKESF